jgi:hypothetical protein
MPHIGEKKHFDFSAARASFKAVGEMVNLTPKEIDQTAAESWNGQPVSSAEKAGNKVVLYGLVGVAAGVESVRGLGSGASAVFKGVKSLLGG